MYRTNCRSTVQYYNILSQDGWTSLHHASLTGHADEVAALVERGASTAVEDIAGYIPLQYAAANTHIEVVHYLLQKAVPTEHLLKDPKVLNVHAFC